MPQRVEKIAVLFADVCGSTSLYENLGDDLARKLIFQCINTMSDKIFAGQGTLVKTIGDEVMATFPSAEAAFHAACSIRDAVDNIKPLDGVPLHIRIGFNFGPVIMESHDVFGNTVNVASRVTAITRAGQIMATQAVFDELPVDLQKKMRQILRAELKGKQDRFDLYQVILEQEDVQSTRIGMPAFRKSPDNIDEMILRYRGRAIKVNKECRSVVLGRDDTCDLVVQNELASRLHIHVELRFGRFIIVDQSTNGTYVRFSDGNVAHITRDEIYLQGNGLISLGQSFAENPDDVVEFAISSAHIKHSYAR
ncbi:MAG TPA: adenylate/guanylate cyclase domain-containing protein [Gallionella sp.]|nr:adenylate/guanylate cyclase domain-containing protein [Gallionella sp.]